MRETNPGKLPFLLHLKRDLIVVKGVRTTGDDPQEVSRYGVAFMKGYKESGIGTCGKHFPSYGNLEILGFSLDVPVITDSLEQLSLSAMVPFRNAIAQDIDAMTVGGCAMSSAGMNVMHACLSERVVDGLLRADLGFNGVVVSDCLEMEALSHKIGVAGGTVMAVNAGCDLVVFCRSLSVQQEAIKGLKIRVKNGMISKSRIRQSLRKVLDLKSKCTSWEKAQAPGGTGSLSSCNPRTQPYPPRHTTCQLRWSGTSTCFYRFQTFSNLRRSYFYFRLWSSLCQHQRPREV